MAPHFHALNAAIGRLLRLVPATVPATNPLVLMSDSAISNSRQIEKAAVIDISRLVGSYISDSHLVVLDANVPLIVDDLGNLKSMVVRDVALHISPANCDVPQSPADLVKLVSEAKYDHLIFDFSLPWNASSEWIADLLPPDVTSLAPRPTDVLAGLLTWAASLPTTKAITVIIPSAIGFGSTFEWVRSAVTKFLPPTAIIELPNDLYRPYYTITGSTLVIFGGSTGSIYFDRVKSRADVINPDGKPWFESLGTWLSGKQPHGGFQKPLCDVTKWAVAPNSPALQTTERRLAKIGKLVKLSDMATIFVGVRTSSLTESDSGVPVIKSGDLMDGSYAVRTARKYQFESAVAAKYILRQGDVLLPRYKGSVAVVYAEPQQAMASDTLLVIRPNPGVNSDHISEFLNSSAGQTFLEAVSVKSMLTPAALGGIRIPLLDREILSGLHDISNVVNHIEMMADELKGRRRALFEADSQTTFRENLAQLKRVGKVLTTAMNTMDRLDYQISSLYPFPIAFGYRLLASKVQLTDLLVEQLRISEAILAFLGSLSLSLLPTADRKGTGLDLKSLWQGGISPGAWRDVIARCSRFLKTQQTSSLSMSIASLEVGSSKKGIGPSIERLITLRNNYMHSRGPSTPEELRTATQSAEQDIKGIMERLAFLTEHPTRLVSDINVTRRGDILLSCIRYMGDHPGLTQEQIYFSRALRKEDMFIEVGPEQWIPLYPFISAHSCPYCKAREVYFIDAFSPERGSVRLKSFDRGHTLDSVENAAALDGWVQE